MKSKFRAASLATIISVGLAAGAAIAQDQPMDTARSLNLPSNPTVFGSGMPSVVKATAIVNGEVITATDVDQRLALMAIANGGRVPADQVDRLRQQVLRNLIDETLQIQAAKANKIDITKADVERTLERVAANVKQTPAQMADYLKANGSSINSIRRQIEGETAWRRLQSAKIESGVNVAEDEVRAVIKRMEDAKGTDEYRVGEIFLASTPATQQQVMANAGQILEQLRSGGSFTSYARQFSEASTQAVGGDLGWIRPEQLPEPIGAALRQMQPGMVSPPIAVAGGVSIIAVQDVRKILAPDPRNAELTLKQVSISFPKGTGRAQAEPVVARFAQAAQNVGGCGGADKLAADFNAEVVESDGVKMRDLPAALQQMMTSMQVGQSTQPFGNLDEGVRVLVLCGRDEQDATMPTYEQVLEQMNEERVNLRARRYLRDLRRDAVIDFR